MNSLVLSLENLVLDVDVVGNHPSLKRLISFDLNSQKSRLIDIASLHVFEGDKICVVGRNGNGKTTLMRLLSRVYAPTSGRIIGEYSPASVLASGIGLDDDLNVIDNIRYIVFLEGGDKLEVQRTTEEILKFCELSPEDARKPFKYFSTGYKSRISFAIATRKKPDLLLLDEVLGGGDEVFMEKARNRVSLKIREARVAFVATHSPEELRGVCNKMLFLKKGRVYFFGEFEAGLTFFQNEMNAEKGI